MPAPLSHDLRIRVVEACKTRTKTEVAALFNVDRRTVHRYLAQQEKEGSVVAKTGYQKGHSHKLHDTQKIEKHILNNPSDTLKNMSKKFGVSHSTVHRMLSKLGITKKKGLHVILSEMKPKEMSFRKKSPH